MFIGRVAFNIMTPFGGQMRTQKPSILGEIPSVCCAGQASLIGCALSKSLKEPKTLRQLGMEP